MKIEKDGNQYCVKADNFINLQKSNDYFFISEEEYKNFISQSNQEIVKEILDRVDKEVIGDYVDIHKFINYENRVRAEGRNRLRSKQRQKLTQLRKVKINK